MLFILGLVFYTFTQGGQFLTLKYLDAVSFSLILKFYECFGRYIWCFFPKGNPQTITVGWYWYIPGGGGVLFFQ